MSLRAELGRLLRRPGPPARVLPLDAPTFRVALARPGRDLVVSFWALSCTACRILAPALERLAGEHPELAVAALDVDRAPRAAERYGIEELPTVIRFHDGEPVAVAVAPGSYDALVEALEVQATPAP